MQGRPRRSVRCARLMGTCTLVAGCCGAAAVTRWMASTCINLVLDATIAPRVCWLPDDVLMSRRVAMLPVGRSVIDTAHACAWLSAPIERQYPPTNSDELSSGTSGIFWKCQTGTVVSGLHMTFPVAATAPMTRAAAPSRSAACCATLLNCVSKRCRKVASAQSLARRRTAQTRAGRWQAVAWGVPWAGDRSTTAASVKVDHNGIRCT